VLWICLIFVGMTMAKGKGYSKLLGFLLTFFIPILGIIIIFLLPARRGSDLG